MRHIRLLPERMLDLHLAPIRLQNVWPLVEMHVSATVRFVIRKAHYAKGERYVPAIPQRVEASVRYAAVRVLNAWKELLVQEQDLHV